MYFRYKTVDPYYGTSFYTIDFSGEQPLIRRKTVVLKTTTSTTWWMSTTSEVPE